MTNVVGTVAVTSAGSAPPPPLSSHSRNAVLPPWVLISLRKRGASRGPVQFCNSVIRQTESVTPDPHFLTFRLSRAASLLCRCRRYIP